MTFNSSKPDSQHLARQAGQAVFWNYTSFGLGKAMVFLTTTILARLLTPADFGVMAFAVLAVNYLSILKDLGLGAALIQRRQNVEEAADTVFTLNLLLGSTLTLLGIGVAPFIAAYFNEPLVTPILRLLSFSFVLNALSDTHIVRLQRELNFRRKLIPDIGYSIIKGVVSIGFALAGFGVWALVIGQLVSAVATVILAWSVFPWRPRLTVRRDLAKTMLSFGLSMTGIQALTTLIDNLDYLIVGRFFGNTALGIYTLAYRLPELLVLNMLWVMAKVIFPTYAAVQDQPDTLRQGFLTVVRFVGMFTVPICLGLMLAAEPLVQVIFGEKWLAAIPVVRVLALFALVSSIAFNVGDIYKAVGRTDILIKLGLVKLVLLVPALWYGAHFGLVGVAVGHVVVATVIMGLRLWVATWFVQVKIEDILRQLMPAFWGGLALTLLVLPTLYLTSAVLPVVRLLLVSMMGGLAYLAVLWLLEGKLLLKAGRLMGLPGLASKSSAPSLALRSARDVEVS